MGLKNTTTTTTTNKNCSIKSVSVYTSATQTDYHHYMYMGALVFDIEIINGMGQQKKLEDEEDVGNNDRG